MKRLKILIVDDHRASSETMALAFNEDGFETTIASSAVEALCMAIDHPFDILIIDYDLRNTYGRIVIDELRKVNPDLRSILVTGHTLDQNVLGLPVDHILNKPLDFDELEAILLRWKRESFPMIKGHDLCMKSGTGNHAL